MRGSSAAHDKAEDHKSQRAFAREQQFGYADGKRLCQVIILKLPTPRRRPLYAALLTQTSRAGTALMVEKRFLN